MPEIIFTRREWTPATDAATTNALTGLRIFAPLRKRQLAKLGRRAEFGRFVPGDLVLAPDAANDFFYVVVGGSAELRGTTSSRTLRRGDCFGEAALLHPTDGSGTVVATDALDVLRVPYAVFRPLVQGNPRVAVAMLRSLAARIDEGQPIGRAA
jgi:CRP-like cAMP-binding protein